MSRETIAHLNTQVLVGFGQVPWHFRQSAQGAESNLYAGAVPIDDVRRRLFNYQAVSGPLQSTILTPEGVVQVNSGEFQVVAHSITGQPFGVFKPGYQIHQFDEWLLKNVATILSSDLGIGSAGVLKKGAVAWVSVEVPDSITTPEGVQFRPRLLATTSHDGSLATTYKRVVTNTVCDNTHAIALREKGQQFKVKHSAKSLNKIGEAREALQIVHSISEEFAAEVKALSEIDVSTKAWDAFVQAQFPLFDDEGNPKAGRGKTLALNSQASLHNLYKHDNRVSPWAGTGWGVVQAVNTWVQHEQTVRGTERVERNQWLTVSGGFDDLDVSTAGLLNKVLATV